MMNYDYIVLGTGIAGYEITRHLMRDGSKNILLIEKELLGGTALINGAVPMKALLDGIKFNTEEGYTSKMARVKAKIEKDLSGKNVKLIYGEGIFKSSNEVEVNGQIYSGSEIIICTGTSPSNILGLEIDGERILSHKDIFNYLDYKGRIIILGGNVEGIEMASYFSEIGGDVTIVEAESELLAGNDRDLVQPIIDRLKENGVSFHIGDIVEAVDQRQDGLRVRLASGNSLMGDKVIVTFARKPNTPKGLENTKVLTSDGFILVNEKYKTKDDSIYALGDINGKHGMAHVAANQALELYNSFKSLGLDERFSYNILSRGIFTKPELAGVGLQEVDLLGKEYKVIKKQFADSFRGISKSMDFGFLKLILDRKNKILGIWMLGEDVIDSVGYLPILLREEMDIDFILSNLVIHPSLGELLREALLEGREMSI